jgi:hypothetical protein
MKRVQKVLVLKCAEREVKEFERLLSGICRAAISPAAYEDYSDRLAALCLAAKRYADLYQREEINERCFNEMSRGILLDFVNLAAEMLLPE